MAMGKRKRERQASLWISSSDLPRSAGHPFYQTLNKQLNAGGFETFVEAACQKYTDGARLGRPSCSA